MLEVLPKGSFQCVVGCLARLGGIITHAAVLPMMLHQPFICSSFATNNKTKTDVFTIFKISRNAFLQMSLNYSSTGYYYSLF